MKNRFILMLVAAVCLLPAFGQENSIRKVAILETIDREGNISTGVKLLVRSNLARAITNTPGYEGYDRVDVASIMGEQDFQRTGMVNNDQIRKLGEMTGASDILVAEVAMIDASNIVITAKILDVESARLLQTAYVQTSTSPAYLERGCNEVAAQLLGESAAVQNIVEPQSASAPVVDHTPAAVQPAPMREKVRKTDRKPFYAKYQGEVDVAYAMGNGGGWQSSLVTVHGVRLTDYAFVGAGAGVQYGRIVGAGLQCKTMSVPVFLNVKGFYPVNDRIAPYLSISGGYSVPVSSRVRVYSDYFDDAPADYKCSGGVYTSFAAGVMYKRWLFELGYMQTGRVVTYTSGYEIDFSSKGFYVGAGFRF